MNSQLELEERVFLNMFACECKKLLRVLIEMFCEKYRINLGGGSHSFFVVENVRANRINVVDRETARRESGR